MIGMTGIHGFHRNDRPEPPSGTCGDVNGLESRHPHVLEVGPQGGCSVEGLNHVDVVYRLAYCGRPKYRIIAVKDSFHLETGFREIFPLTTRIIPRVFSEGSLWPEILRIDLTF